MKGSSFIFSSALPLAVHATSSTTPGLPRSSPRSVAEAKAASVRKNPPEGQRRWTQLTKSPSLELMDQPSLVVQRHMMRAGFQLTISIDLKLRESRLEEDPRVGASSQSRIRWNLPSRYRLAWRKDIFWKAHDINGHCTISLGSLGMLSCIRGQSRVKSSKSVDYFSRNHGYVKTIDVINPQDTTTLCFMLVCKMTRIPENIAGLSSRRVSSSALAFCLSFLFPHLKLLLQMRL